MNKLTVCSIFAAIALAVAMPSAFADHPTVEVSIAAGSSSPGCEETDECFTPSEVTTDVGSEVVWSNDDTAGHTVTSGTIEDSESVGAIFDSSLFMAGKTFSYKFEEAGEFPYFCVVHPWMAGTVIVQEAGAEEAEETEEHEESESYVTAASADGSVLVKVGSGKPTNGEELALTVEFEGTDGSPIEHVNYDISATQDGAEVLNEAGRHTMSGMDEFTTAALSSDSPVDVQVTILGLGPEGEEAGWTGPKGDVVKVQVVPEFGQVAAMVLAASIISIVAVTAKSKVIPRL